MNNNNKKKKSLSWSACKTTSIYLDIIVPVLCQKLLVVSQKNHAHILPKIQCSREAKSWRDGAIAMRPCLFTCVSSPLLASAEKTKQKNFCSVGRRILWKLHSRWWRQPEGPRSAGPTRQRLQEPVERKLGAVFGVIYSTILCIL